LRHGFAHGNEDDYEERLFFPPESKREGIANV